MWVPTDVDQAHTSVGPNRVSGVCPDGGAIPTASLGHVSIYVVTSVRDSAPESEMETWGPHGPTNTWVDLHGGRELLREAAGRRSEGVKESGAVWMGKGGADSVQRVPESACPTEGPRAPDTSHQHVCHLVNLSIKHITRTCCR